VGCDVSSLGVNNGSGDHHRTGPQRRFTDSIDLRVNSDPTRINFPSPGSSGNFHTLVVNNLIGSGAIFGMSVDLANLRGDLLVIQTPSTPPPGGFNEHKLLITNINQGSDLPGNEALLVVKTAQTTGLAFPSNKVDGGTFKYVTE
jgi:hypothetical protein